MKANFLDDFSEKADQLRIMAIVVRQNGEVIAEKFYDDETRTNQFSTSKSFASCAVGFAVQEGLLSLDEKVVDCFPKELPQNPDSNLEKMTLRHLMTMSIGHSEGYLMWDQRVYLPTDEDWVKYSLALPLPYMPGEKFCYCNTGPYLMGILVQRRSGCRNLVDYLMPRLFEPLGIYRPTWETDNEGYTFAASGLFLTTRELSRFIQIYLDGGVYGGRRLISKEWIDESKKCHVKDSDGPGPDYMQGYGYYFWRGPNDSYRTDGRHGQFGYIFEKQNATIAINAECREQQDIHDHMWATVFSKL